MRRRTADCMENVKGSAKLCIDDHSAYEGLPHDHETVNRRVKEYVRDQARTSGIESFWALLRRGHRGAYHKMSMKHPGRCVNEFAGWRSARPMDTIKQTALAAGQMAGRRLRRETQAGGPIDFRLPAQLSGISRILAYKMRHSFLVFPALALIPALAAGSGLHNNGRTFTPAYEMKPSDWNDPAELERAWQSALVRIPKPDGRFIAAAVRELHAHKLEGSGKFPTVIYLHGCYGLWSGTYTRIDFLASNGYAVIAPLSMARKNTPGPVRSRQFRAAFTGTC